MTKDLKRVSEADAAHLMDRTTEIVVAYINHTDLSIDDVGRLIRKVRSSLVGEMAAPVAPSIQDAPPLVPAVPIAQSITPDNIVCLECGKPQRSMKRHLEARHSLSPERYREKWGLDRRYPMAAPEYSERRSLLAKRSGLGK